jgi:hypothetical protein
MLSNNGRFFIGQEVELHPPIQLRFYDDTVYSYSMTISAYTLRTNIFVHELPHNSVL